MRKAKVYINNDSLNISSDVLRAITHPLRMKILEFIDNNANINADNNTKSVIR